MRPDPIEALLDRTYAIERAALTAGLESRILRALPRTPAPLVRAARMIAAASVLGALAVAVLGAHLLSVRTDPLALLRVAFGGGAALTALLLVFAAPRFAALEDRLTLRLTGHHAAPATELLVRFRLAGVGLLVAACVVMGG